MPAYKYTTEEERKDANLKSIKEYKLKNKEIINERAREKKYCKYCHEHLAKSAFARHEKLEKHLKNKYGDGEYLYKLKVYNEDGDRIASIDFRKKKDLNIYVKKMNKNYTYKICNLH